MVGDGHAMSVTTQIVQHIFGTTKGAFQVHHPVLAKQWSQPSRKDLVLREEFQLLGEAELTIPESLAKRSHELATKDLAEYCFGQEVVF